jgi:hypothetical protein
MIIFMGGSRAVRSLPPEVVERLQSALRKGAAFVLGDANGADKAFQQYLYDQCVSRVTVYCAKGGPRNNVGEWPIEVVESREKRKTYEYYTAKDRAMAKRADAGLVVWDGKSKGTLLQAWRLAVAGKHVAVYIAGRSDSMELSSPADWDSFMGTLSAELQSELKDRMGPEPGKAKTLFESLT